MRRCRGSPGGSSKSGEESVLIKVVRGRAPATLVCTASARFAVCDSAPLVACAVIVKLPVGAFAAAPNTTAVLVPDATLKGLAGFEVTPLGSPPSVICTVPLNPFEGLTETFTAPLVAPCITVVEFVERTTEKSAGVGGGGWTLAIPPPQPAHARSSVPRNISGTHGLDRPIERPQIHSAAPARVSLPSREAASVSALIPRESRAQACILTMDLSS